MTHPRPIRRFTHRTLLTVFELFLSPAPAGRYYPDGYHLPPVRDTHDTR